MKEGIILAMFILLALAGIIFWKDIRAAFSAGSKNEVRKEAKKGERVTNSGDVELGSGTVQVINRYDLPVELKEISGITYLGNGSFACVQDEQGVIYFYNTTSGNIEKELVFAGTGDFEGIARKGDVYYVVRADGRLFGITEKNDEVSAVKEYETGLTIKDNVESLCFDEKTNRFLLIGKDENKQKDGKREVIAFDPDLGTGKSLFTVSIGGAVSKKRDDKFSPSAIGIDPLKRDILLVDGPAAKVYRLDSTGHMLEQYTLDKKQFPQAEGISFGPGGEVYISTEGTKGRGAILEVQLN